MQNRRSFSAGFKAKAAIKAVKEQQILQELAQKYGLHPSQLSAWKQEFEENAACAFTRGKKKEEESVGTGRPYEETCRLRVEVDFLKIESPASAWRRKEPGLSKITPG